MKIPENIREIMQRLIDADYEAYIVGGAVRDYLLGVEPHDYDIFCNCPKEKLLEIFPTAKIVGGSDRQEKLFTIIIDNVEISQYRCNGKRTKTFN